MKEKYENDMKKEIKKLQRLRDFFRQGIGSTDIKDKSKLQEAKSRIEDQMENFRELEKEYKQKKLTKVAYQNHNEIEGKFLFSSGEDDSSEDDDRARRHDVDYFEDSEAGSEGSRGNSFRVFQEEDFDPAPVDKEGFISLAVGEIKEQQARHENEINSIRNMKKGSVKKNKDRIAHLMGCIAHLKAVRERLEELNIGLDYVEPRRMRACRHMGTLFVKSPEDESLRQQLISELNTLIEISEHNRQ